MRIGTNPEKFKNKVDLDSYHRVIIPVYIPHFNDYFKDGLEIFKLCIGSLLKTIHSKTRITIYNNASDSIVKEFIDDLYAKEPLIDQVFHSKVNLGKINATLAGAKGNLEPLITITDADVFFKQGWQSNVESLFTSFEEAGMVSPVPLSNSYKGFTNVNWYYGFTKGKISMEDVYDKDGLVKFEESLGRDKPFFSEVQLRKFLVLNNKKSSAAMGCGHFVATLRREVFDLGTNSPAIHKIHSEVENKFIDIPNQNLGFLRLATLNNYAYHLGNTKESWMEDELNNLANDFNEKELTVIPTLKRISKNKVKIGAFIKKVLMSSYFKTIYLKSLGLTKEEAKNF